MIMRRIELKEVDSTNEYAKTLLDTGEDWLIVSDIQTRGKGRRGNTWVSDGENIYMSFLLHTKMEISQVSLITLVSAYSVSRVLEAYNIEAGIKWPNDIVIHKKKVCGILTELCKDAKGAYHIIIGIGLNVNENSFPEEIKDIASSLYLETGRIYDKKKLVDDIEREICSNYQIFEKEKTFDSFKAGYEEKLLNKGQQVRVIGDTQYEALALGIDGHGNLLVEKDGTVIPINSGEVSVRGLYGYT